MSSHQATGEYAPSNSSSGIKYIFTERAAGSPGLQVEITNSAPYPLYNGSTYNSSAYNVYSGSDGGSEDVLFRVSGFQSDSQGAGKWMCGEDSDPICDLQKAAVNVSSWLFHAWDVQYVSTLSGLLCPLPYPNRNCETVFGSWKNFPAPETCLSTPE